MADVDNDKYTLSEETLKFLREFFRMKDLDESGTLDRDELREALPIMGFYPTEEDLDWVLKHFDTDKSGRLEIEELIASAGVLEAHINNKEQIMAAFKKFDISGDGCIRLPELLKVLTYNDAMDPQQASALVDELVRKHDKNRDGKFNFAEFVSIYLDDKYDFITREDKTS